MSVLVTYASKHGSTKEIARTIGARLAVRGVSAELRDVASVDGLERYDAVVLGSAVYAGSWMKQARDFVRTFEAELRARPVWLFSSGPTGVAGDERPVSEKQLLELATAVHPREHEILGGRLDPEDLGFLERRVVKLVKASTGDFRDWEEIRAFADRIADDRSRASV